MVLYHSVLGQLLANCLLQISYTHLHSLTTESLGSRILIGFEAFDVEVDGGLGLDVFDVSSAQINISLFLNDF